MTIPVDTLLCLQAMLADSITNTESVVVNLPRKISEAQLRNGYKTTSHTLLIDIEVVANKKPCSFIHFSTNFDMFESCETSCEVYIEAGANEGNQTC